MHHGIEIGGTRLTLSNGQPVAYRTFAGAKEAQLCIIGALVISAGPGQLLPQVCIVELPTVAATNQPVPITNDTAPTQDWIDANPLPLVDTPERTAKLAPSPKRSPLPYIFHPGHEDEYSDLQVLQSGAGWYIGTLYTHPDASDTPGLVEPGTRDSYDYYPSQREAQFALDNDTFIQRDHV